MKVKELIEQLQQMPQNYEVITDLHSEYSLVKSVSLVEAYEKGGYISRSYQPSDKLRLHGYVYVGVGVQQLIP